jgi:hypothetical protein
MRSCGGRRLGNDRQQTPDPGDDVEGRNIAVLEHVHQAGALAVDADDIGLRGKTVAHMGNVVYVDDRSVHALDGEIVQVPDGGRGAIGGQLVLERSHLDGSGRQDQILHADGVDHVVGGKSSGLQRLEVEIHLHLALLAAVGIGTFSTLDGGQLGADEIQSEVIQLLFGEALAGETKLQNGHTRCVKVMIRGGVVPWGRKRNWVCDTAVICAMAVAMRDVGLEINLHHPNAHQRLRFNVVDIVDRGGQRALSQGDDAVGHIHRGEALILPNDADHRNIDVGENVDRGIQNGERTEDQQ